MSDVLEAKTGDPVSVIDVEGVSSVGFAEDGTTLVILFDLVNGRTGCMSIDLAGACANSGIRVAD